MIFGALLSFLAVRVRRWILGRPIEIAFEYLIWALQWACWLLDGVFRIPLVFLDLLGVELRASMRVSVVVLEDGGGEPVVPLETARRWLQEAEAILGRCGILLIPCGVEVAPKPEGLGPAICAPAGVFRRFFTWFSARVGQDPRRVTVYVVDCIRGASGCAYPGCNWVMVAPDADGTIVLHEIGHLCDLWLHSSDPDNVMTVLGGGSHDRITRVQRSILRTARFARLR